MIRSLIKWVIIAVVVVKGLELAIHFIGNTLITALSS